MQFNYYNLDSDKHDHDTGYTSISVIASFRSDGQFIPLKAQIIENGERITIDLTVRRHEEIKAFIKYDCYYNYNGYKKSLTLYYFITDHKWYIKTII